MCTRGSPSPFSASTACLSLWHIVELSPSEASTLYSKQRQSVMCLLFLSLFQRNLTEYFVAVDVNNMLQLYASMLHERRIIITSSKLSTVSPFPPKSSSQLDVSAVRRKNTILQLLERRFMSKHCWCRCKFV